MTVKNRVISSFPNLTLRLWVAILALFLSPNLTSTKIKRKTGRHRYTVFHVYDTDDGPVTESFNVLAYNVDEAILRRNSQSPMYSVEPCESCVFKGWNAVLHIV